MSYAKIPTDFLTDPRMLSLAPEAFAAYVRMILFAQHHLTDGFIPLVALPLCTVGSSESEQKNIIKSLTTSKPPLITKLDNGLQIEGWQSYSESKSVIDEKRNYNTQRIAAWRSSKRNQNEPCNNNVTLLQNCYNEENNEKNDQNFAQNIAEKVLSCEDSQQISRSETHEFEQIFDEKNQENLAENQNVDPKNDDCNENVTALQDVTLLHPVACANNNNSNNNREKKEMLKEKISQDLTIFEFLPTNFLNEENLKAWENYQKHRAQKRIGSYTEIGLKTLAKQLVSRNCTPADFLSLIELTIAKNWQGIPPDRIWPQKRTQNEPEGIYRSAVLNSLEAK